MLPFTTSQFLAVFASYNAAIWPIQIVAYLVGLGLVALLYWKSGWSGRAIAAGLALFWLWTGAAYHGTFFSAINPAAYAFAALFVVQGLLFAWFGVVRTELSFGAPKNGLGWLGAAFVAYAAVLYPLIGMITGHAYPEMPMFGVTPCPVTLFTFGMLLLTTARVSWWLLVIPFLWSLVGGSAAVVLAVPQDWVLLVSGVIVVPLLVLRDRRSKPVMA